MQTQPTSNTLRAVTFGPLMVERIAYRGKLVRLLRKTYLRWADACEAAGVLSTAIRYDDAAAKSIRNHCNHLLRRYNLLESHLAEECGLSKTVIYNDLVNSWPLVPRLLYTNL